MPESAGLPLLTGSQIGWGDRCGSRAARPPATLPSVEESMSEMRETRVADSGQTSQLLLHKYMKGSSAFQTLDDAVFTLAQGGGMLQRRRLGAAAVHGDPPNTEDLLATGARDRVLVLRRVGTLVPAVGV